MTRLSVFELPAWSWRTAAVSFRWENGGNKLRLAEYLEKLRPSCSPGRFGDENVPATATQA
jgi:hypothetical protein